MEIDKSIIKTVRHFNISLSDKKCNRDIEYLRNVINKPAYIHMCMLYSTEPQNAKYTHSFSGAHETFIKIRSPLTHEVSVDICQIILSQAHSIYRVIRKLSGKLKLRDNLQNT